MPDWFTVFPNLRPDDTDSVSTVIQALISFSKAAGIPESAAWRAFQRGNGIVVTAEWAYGAPGAIPATQIGVLHGVPVLVEGEIDGEEEKGPV